MNKAEACAILRVPIEASRSDIETAFRTRMREVRALSEAARELSLRAQYRPEMAAIRDAHDFLVRESVVNPGTDPALDEPPVPAPKPDEPPSPDRILEEPKSDKSEVDELPAEEPRAVEPPATLIGEDDRKELPSLPVSTLAQLRLGQLFVSRYELQRELEIGSTGAIWLAQDRVSQRQVALKFLPTLISNHKPAIEDLRNEIRRRAALNHSNILHIFDLVEDEGKAAIEIEYPAGRNLSELRSSRPNHVFEIEDLETWVKELCQALQYAHEEARLIHGNIQPANLTVDRSGSLKVKDFGISNCINETISRLTGAPKTSEALQYKSPQQAAGEQAAIADDLYSLGATLYESLTGKPPFAAPAVALQSPEKKPPSMTERRAELGISGAAIPKNWEETVAACLAADPGQRPRSAIEVAKRLEHVVPPPDILERPQPPPLPPPPAGRPPSPPPLAKTVTPSIPDPPRESKPSAARKPWLAIVGISLVLAFVTGVAYFSFLYLTRSKVGRLDLRTSPPEANVFVDETFRGTTPLTLGNVTPGERRLRIELKGYETEQEIVPVKQGGPGTSLVIQLAPIKGPTPGFTVPPSPSEYVGNESSSSSATPSTEGSTSSSSAVNAPPSPQATATPDRTQPATPSPTVLSEEEVDTTKGDVIKRIDALPGVSAEAKGRLIEKLDRARSMERLTVIPFEIGETVLHGVAANEVVTRRSSWWSPAMPTPVGAQTSTSGYQGSERSTSLEY
jgi:serine/threonine protein kinase